MNGMRECDLCGLGCGSHPWQQHVDDAERYFCCVGCMNVYLILWESGTIRAGQDIRETELFQRSLKLGLISNRNPQEAASGEPTSSAGAEELILRVTGMWCTSCAWLIEHALRSLPGAVQVEASFASDLVKVQYRPQVLPPARIVERIQKLGYNAEKPSTDSDAAAVERRDLIIRTGLAAFLWANVMSFSLVLYAGYFEQISGSVRRGLPFLLMALATPVIFYCAQPVLRLAWRGLLNCTLRMESLLALGILAAYGYSVVQAFRGEIHLYFDTATVIVVLVLAGKLIERSAKERVSQWITQLHRMMPNKVRLLAGGEERFVSVAALQPGEIFVVKAGERIPADGVVNAGESHTDESLLTGESEPLAKRAGQSVVAGSINLDGVLNIQATKTANDSTLSRIVSLVEQALSSRSHVECTVDRVSRMFVPCVVAIALLTFLVTWLVVGETLAHALMRAITVLVIACPCALGLATPMAITAAFGSASRRGILVRDARVLETLRRVDTVVLDKTGTVTDGKFSLLELVRCEARPAQVRVPVLIGEQNAGEQRTGNIHDQDPPEGSSSSEERSVETLRRIASVEQYSEHPLGRAIVDSARQQRLALCDATNLEIHKGCGITGTVDVREIFVGNRRLVHRLNIRVDEGVEKHARKLENEGKTVALAGWDGELHALAVFGNRLKPDAVELVRELKRRGIEVHLISGDARATTKWTASCLGADHYAAEVLPEEKIEVVQRLQEHGAVVAMVGDGINDAPALAQSDLGIAMGSGADVAMQAAAVVLMNGSLRQIVDVFDLSQQTMRVIRQNLFWAFFYNTAGISLAVAGILNPIIAASAMLLSSLSVVANSLRLARRGLREAGSFS